MSRRLRRQINHDFPGFEDEVERLLALADSGNQDRERVLAAIVFTASGDLERLEHAVELSHQDWRDVLLGSRLRARTGQLCSTRGSGRSRREGEQRLGYGRFSRGTVDQVGSFERSRRRLATTVSIN